MTDEQLIVLAAAILTTSGKYDANTPEPVRIARELFEENRKRGSLPTPEIRKATLSKPTIEQWNEGYEGRMYDKNRGK
jgi:hypothetical protein